jgi:two-component system sensor histidine kinase ChiS
MTCVGIVNLIRSIATLQKHYISINIGIILILFAGVFEIFRSRNIFPDIDYIKFGFVGLFLSIAYFFFRQVAIKKNIETMIRESLEKEIVEKNRIIIDRSRVIESELEIAREIQSRLLPVMNTRIDGIVMKSVYLPIDKVGGDFFDYHTDGDTVRFIIADVSGHGVPGAFLGLITKLSFKNMVGQGLDDVRILHELNRIVREASAMSHFVSAFLCTISLKLMEVKYANAGHLPVLHSSRTTGHVGQLFVKGPVLGVFEKTNFFTETMKFDTGDRLLLYTDGIIECRSQNSDFFGLDRLIFHVMKSNSREISESLKMIIESAHEHIGSDMFEDDVTMVMIEFS